MADNKKHGSLRTAPVASSKASGPHAHDDKREHTPADQSGRSITIRTSVAMEALLAQYITQIEEEELRRIDRTEAARRLLIIKLTELRGEQRDTKQKEQ